MENFIDFNCLLMIVLECPLFLRFLLCWSRMLAKFLGSGFVLRNLVASPTMMPLPVPSGWYESCLSTKTIFIDCFFHNNGIKYAEVVLNYDVKKYINPRLQNFK